MLGTLSQDYDDVLQVVQETRQTQGYSIQEGQGLQIGSRRQTL